VADTPQEHRRLTVLAFYGWREFWSMGEGRGAPSFFLSITSFPRHGHEMHVVMPARPGTPRREDYHGVTLHRVRSVIQFMPGAGSSKFVHHVKLLFSYIYWFVRALPVGFSLARRLQPDAIFGMGELGARAGYLVARARNLPLVTRFFGIGLFIEDIRESRLRRMLRYREIAAFRTPSDYMIVHNDGSCGDELARMLGVDMDRFLFYLDGVDKALFLNAEPDHAAVSRLGVPSGNRIVLSVARLYEEKHVDRLVRAAPGVLAERSDVTFLVAGEGEERERLEALIAELGVGDNVILAGSIPHDDLPGIYAASDMFVTLADRTNAFNTLYESMLSALPVIALDTGSTSDFVEDGGTGVLLSMEELPSLPRVILDLLSDEARARSLGEAARARMDETFPTIEERQAMEVEVVERAVRERAR
jgi:glycosyltransferase involved in cell wall biosynthesis